MSKFVLVNDAINQRYSSLSETSCCLSCGGAINYANPVGGEICLDLGSGRGNDVIRMAESVGETGFVYGIDISDGMIAKAEANIQKFDVANAKIIKSELEDLKMEDNFVNLVISNCTINHAKDKFKVWAEVHRVLKPGARFVVSDIYSIEPIEEIYKNDPVAVAECWAGAITRAEYLTVLEQTGFEKIRIFEESQPYEKGKATVASFTISGYKKN